MSRLTGLGIRVAAAGAALLLLLAMGVAVVVWSAGETRAQEGTAVSAVVSPLLQYQGRLSDPATGKAVPDGSYTMTLRLYNTPAGGTPLWTETKDVPLKGGLFSTALGDITPLDHDLFDGRALWLGIKVGADAEAAPRQQMLPVAYALSLVPGAAIAANNSAPTLNLTNSGSGEALYVDGPATVNGNLTVKGAVNNPDIVTQYEFQDHVYGGMHSGRAIAYATIADDGTILSSSGNVTCTWSNLWKAYEITIAGEDYVWQNYVTVVTPVIGGMTSAWSRDGKLNIGFYEDATTVVKRPFQFVTYKP